MKWGLSVVAVGALLFLAVAAADGEVWEEDEGEVVIRSERAAKARSDPCRYAKGAWSECDTKSNTRTRTLTLKKGDSATCEQTKTIQKKCKKACRYDKGAWGECSNGRMARTDVLRSNSDPSCEQARQITKKCKPKGQKKAKGTRRNKQ
ncbi:hypothetical protein ONE63_010287 [Megalurothrips usitatus]|uniref:Pleiotrophin/Midkine C-terminal domain-containing protein n=1 Tax=Megalurothrips usitatus TaxID=439358 RepID=A0AAV7XHC2_9NEOP|nr:hypothetical protein ONE63_010287 [Megalurothrips usitatus]